MNKFCFGAIYNGRLWEKELCVSAQHKIAIYTAAVPEPIQIFTRLPCVHIKLLFTRQPFKSQIGYIHCCRVYTKIIIYMATVQEPNPLYTLLPGVWIKLLFTRQPFKSQFKIESRLLGSHIQCLITEPNRNGRFDDSQDN